MRTKKLTLIAMLVGFALVIFIIEAQIPPLAPIPGIKLGLANIINLMTLYMLGRKESFAVLVLRSALSSIFAGGMTSFLYSISGGLVSFLFMSGAAFFLKENRMWAVSELGAVGHNIGQIITAMLVLHTEQIIWYLPILTVSALITGFFTGMTAQITVKRLRASGVLKAFSEVNANV